MYLGNKQAYVASAQRIADLMAQVRELCAVYVETGAVRHYLDAPANPPVESDPPISDEEANENHGLDRNTLLLVNSMAAAFETFATTHSDTIASARSLPSG